MVPNQSSPTVFPAPVFSPSYTSPVMSDGSAGTSVTGHTSVPQTDTVGAIVDRPQSSQSSTSSGDTIPVSQMKVDALRSPERHRSGKGTPVGTPLKGTPLKKTLARKVATPEKRATSLDEFAAECERQATPGKDKSKVRTKN